MFGLETRQSRLVVTLVCMLLVLSACGSPDQDARVGSEADFGDLRARAAQDAEDEPLTLESERDNIFSLLPYAIVLKDWQDGRGDNRGYNIGSILVDGDSRIVFWARNAVFATGSTTQHAELRTMNCYLTTNEPFSLKSYTLYATLEPCSMCAGMMLFTSLTRTVYGQTDPAFGDAVERLALDSSELDDGHDPYPRQTISDAAPLLHRYWLDCVSSAHLGQLMGN